MQLLAQGKFLIHSRVTALRIFFCIDRPPMTLFFVVVVVVFVVRVAYVILVQGAPTDSVPARIE